MKNDSPSPIQVWEKRLFIPLILLVALTTCSLLTILFLLIETKFDHALKSTTVSAATIHDLVPLHHRQNILRMEIVSDLAMLCKFLQTTEGSVSETYQAMSQVLRHQEYYNNVFMFDGKGKLMTSLKLVKAGRNLVGDFSKDLPDISFENNMMRCLVRDGFDNPRILMIAEIDDFTLGSFQLGKSDEGDGHPELIQLVVPNDRSSLTEALKPVFGKNPSIVDPIVTTLIETEAARGFYQGKYLLGRCKDDSCSISIADPGKSTGIVWALLILSIITLSFIAWAIILVIWQKYFHPRFVKMNGFGEFIARPFDPGSIRLFKRQEDEVVDFLGDSWNIMLKNIEGELGKQRHQIERLNLELSLSNKLNHNTRVNAHFLAMNLLHLSTNDMLSAQFYAKVIALKKFGDDLSRYQLIANRIASTMEQSVEFLGIVASIRRSLIDPKEQRIDCDITKLITDTTIRMAGERLSGKNIAIKVTTTTPSPFHCDETIIAEMIKLILTNFIELTCADTAIIVGCNWKQNHLIFYFRSKWHDPDLATDKRLFDPFGSETLKVGKTIGVNLLLAREIADRYHGTIAFNKGVNNIVSALIELPLKETHPP